MQYKWILAASFSMNTPDIDWSKHDPYPEHTLTCGCGQVFRSHCKTVPGVGIVSRRTCPGCDGHNRIVRASSDPETMTIKG